MQGKFKKIWVIILKFLIVLVIVLVIPIIHDIIVDNIDIKDYEIKNGTISDVSTKREKVNGKYDICENIKVDNYKIFVGCKVENQFKQKNKVGDTIEYYVYKDKAYYTINQMKSDSFIVKILDYGMFAVYFLIAILICFL